jgi:hypothetical protein
LIRVAMEVADVPIHGAHPIDIRCDLNGHGL